MASHRGRQTGSLGATLDPALGAVVFCAVIGIVLLATMFLGRRRAPQERRLTPIFQTSCSGTFGRFGGANYPLFQLRIYVDFLVIGLFAPHVIPFSRLARVEVRGGPLMGRRLCIEIEGGGTYQLRVANPDNVARLLHERSGR
jgi:hypothetical protein